MRHGDAAFAQEFLHVAIAQGAPIVEPAPMADDCAGEAVVLVAHGVGRGVMPGCLSWGSLLIEGTSPGAIMPWLRRGLNKLTMPNKRFREHELQHLQKKAAKLGYQLSPA